MSPLGTLLRHRRAGDTRLAWNLPALRGPELLTPTSPDFTEAGPVPREHAGRRIGGGNRSPALGWPAPPPGTAQLLLVVEDPDVPLARPAVHCLALIDPGLAGSPHQLPAGGLSARAPAPGVRVLRSTLGRGYQGPAPLKGHGAHRYVFQLFALPRPVDSVPGPPERARPRAFLARVTGPVLARGKLTGTYER